ncbi:MAG TPA: nitrous oxide-stimulated promoter family protein [Planctomycetota bacterium]|jgi:hypothetical protein
MPDPQLSPKLLREFRTVSAMVALYCKDKHGGGEELCGECAELLDFVRQRLSKCPFKDEKPTCANCQIHCYKAEYRVRIRDVMRYAGPRMMLKHPVLALQHVLKGRRKAPALRRGRS